MVDVVRKLDTTPDELVAEAIWDKKGFDVRAYDVRGILDYTDCMVICSAASDRQVGAIAENVADEVRTQQKIKPLSTEGVRQGRWALLDFSDVVVHVFHRPVRDYYELDRLYADAPKVALNAPEWDTRTDPTWASADDWSKGPLAAGHDITDA